MRGAFYMRSIKNLIIFIKYNLIHPTQPHIMLSLYILKEHVAPLFMIFLYYLSFGYIVVVFFSNDKIDFDDDDDDNDTNAIRGGGGGVLYIDIDNIDNNDYNNPIYYDDDDDDDDYNIRKRI